MHAVLDDDKGLGNAFDQSFWSDNFRSVVRGSEGQQEQAAESVCAARVVDAFSAGTSLLVTWAGPMQGRSNNLRC